MSAFVGGTRLVRRKGAGRGVKYRKKAILSVSVISRHPDSTPSFPRREEGWRRKEDDATMSADDQEQTSKEHSEVVGNSAIKWSAIVIIVLAVLYFLARYVIPLFQS